MSDGGDIIEPVLCSKCFRNQGLRLDAIRIGVESPGTCPNCHADDGAKLDKDRAQTLAFHFFVRGTYRRTKYGGAPTVQFNEQHYQKTDLCVPDSLRSDIALIEKAAQVGFFSYGPRLWMIGEVEPLKSLQDPQQRSDVIKRILEVYPQSALESEDVFYRLRSEPKNPADPSEYDSPPDSFLGKYRFDSPTLPILYASQDLEVCIHECRVSVEDELYVATLRPSRTLRLLDLTEIVEDEVTEFESIDIAIHMLFLASDHSYEISREIAVAAKAAGIDGIIYPSYFSVVRTGRLPIETAYGISLRRFKTHKTYANAQIIPNLALFGRPVKSGSVFVDCVNRLVLTRITYDGVFGPVGF